MEAKYIAVFFVFFKHFILTIVFIDELKLQLENISHNRKICFAKELWPQL